MRVLPTVNLTGYQKVLLAKIAHAPESPNGGKRVHLNNDKLVSAKEFLLRLNLIRVDPETQLISLSDEATTLMQEEGILDETGQLTDIGKRFVAGDLPSEENIIKNPKPKTPPQQLPPMEKFHISFKDFLKLCE